MEREFGSPRLAGTAWVPYVPINSSRTLALTICIAVHCADRSIIGISDRMLSRDRKRHTPPLTKVFGLHHSIALMYAGGVTLNGGITHATGDAIQAKFGPKTEGPTVLQAARTYRREYLREQRDLAEASVLQRYLFASGEEYRTERPNLAPDLREEIDAELTAFRFEPEEGPCVIIAGIDDGGAQIYEVSGERVNPRNPLGFAVIGGNSEKAAQLLHDRHSPHLPFGEALMLAYIAKRSAENRKLGVGEETDIFILGPQRRRFMFDSPLTAMLLKQIYDEMIVRKHGGPELAIQYAGLHFRDSPHGSAPMPPIAQPPNPPAPQSPSESTDGP